MHEGGGGHEGGELGDLHGRPEDVAREAAQARGEKDGPEQDGAAMRFARDQVFASPSAAAAVVVGRTANGRNDWKIQGSGTSFGSWQAQGIDQAFSDGSSGGGR